MHEMSLMEALVDLAEEEARKADARRIAVLRVAVGALSHVDPHALRFCFDAVVRGSMCEGAALDLHGRSRRRLVSRLRQGSRVG